MTKDTWVLLGVFAAGFLILAGLMLGVHDRLNARIDHLDAKLDAKIESLAEKLSGEIGKVQAGQAVIRERLMRLEILVGIAEHDHAPIVEDEGDHAS